MNDLKTESKKKKSLKQVAKYFLIYLGVMCLIVAVPWFGWGAYWSSQIRTELQNIKDAGQPLSFEDLAADRLSLDTPDNAGPIYHQAMELIGDQEYDCDNVILGLKTEDKSGKPVVPSNDELIAAKEILDKHENVLALIDQAAQMQNCEYDLGQSLGFEEPLDSYGDVRNLYRISSLRSQYLACTNQLEQAAKSIDSTLKIQRMFLRHPVLISELVRISINAGVIDDVSLLLNQGNVSDDVLLGLRNMLEETNSYYDLKRMAMGERVCGIYSMNYAIVPSVRNGFFPDEINHFKGMYPIEKTGVGVLVLGRYVAAKMLQDANSYVDMIDESWHDSLSRIGSIPEDESIANILSWDVNRYGFISVALGKVANDIAIIAVHIEHFRNRERRLPHDLNELAHRFPDISMIDPFTGKQFGYLINEHDYVIYTVSKNGIDDGGAIEEASNAEGGRLDWGIRISK